MSSTAGQSSSEDPEQGDQSLPTRVVLARPSGKSWGDLGTCAPDALMRLRSFHVTSFSDIDSIEQICRGYHENMGLPLIHLQLTCYDESVSERVAWNSCLEPGNVFICFDAKGLAHKFLAHIPPTVAARVTHLDISCIEEMDAVTKCATPYFPGGVTGGYLQPGNRQAFLDHGKDFTSLGHLHVTHPGEGFYGNNCVQLNQSTARFVINTAASLLELAIEDNGAMKMWANPLYFMVPEILKAIGEGNRLKYLSVCCPPNWNWMSVTSGEAPPRSMHDNIKDLVETYCKSLVCPAKIDVWFPPGSRAQLCAVVVTAAMNAGADSITARRAIEEAGLGGLGVVVNEGVTTNSPAVVSAALISAASAVAAAREALAGGQNSGCAV